jgi:hypothetical protein
MTWTEQPAGDALRVPAGYSVALVASVKSNHDAAALHAFASSRGVTITDYAEEGQRAGVGPDPRGPGYRYVAAMGTASSAVELPWEAPWPLSMFDGSQLVRAWVSPAPGPAPASPAPSTPTSGPAPNLWPLAALFGVGGWLWLRGRRRRRRR